MKISQKIKERIDAAGGRSWANDNISQYLEEGDKQKLIDEAMPAFENVLKSLVIDTETDISKPLFAPLPLSFGCLKLSKTIT